MDPISELLAVVGHRDHLRGGERHAARPDALQALVEGDPFVAQLNPPDLRPTNPARSHLAPFPLDGRQHTNRGGSHNRGVDDQTADLLISAHQTGAKVTIAVTSCLYACCGRAWQTRTGYEQLYTGKVAEIEPKLVLHAWGIGTLSYVVVAAPGDVADAVYCT